MASTGEGGGVLLHLQRSKLSLHSLDGPRVRSSHSSNIITTGSIRRASVDSRSTLSLVIEASDPGASHHILQYTLADAAAHRAGLRPSAIIDPKHLPHLAAIASQPSLLAFSSGTAIYFIRSGSDQHRIQNIEDTGHSEPVTHLAVSLNAQFIISGSKHHCVVHNQATSKNEILTIRSRSELQDISTSPFSPNVFCITLESKILLFDLNTHSNKPVTSFNFKNVLSSNEVREKNVVIFTSNFSYVNRNLLVFISRCGKIGLADISSYKLVGTLTVDIQSPSTCINLATFSPDGRTLVLLTSDGVIFSKDLRSSVQIELFRIDSVQLEDTIQLAFQPIQNSNDIGISQSDQKTDNRKNDAVRISRGGIEREVGHYQNVCSTSSSHQYRSEKSKSEPKLSTCIEEKRISSPSSLLLGHINTRESLGIEKIKNDSRPSTASTYIGTKHISPPPPSSLLGHVNTSSTTRESLGIEKIKNDSRPSTSSTYVGTKHISPPPPPSSLLLGHTHTSSSNKRDSLATTENKKHARFSIGTEKLSEQLHHIDLGGSKLGSSSVVPAPSLLTAGNNKLGLSCSNPSSSSSPPEQVISDPRSRIIQLSPDELELIIERAVHKALNQHTAQIERWVEEIRNVNVGCCQKNKKFNRGSRERD